MKKIISVNLNKTTTELLCVYTSSVHVYIHLLANKLENIHEMVCYCPRWQMNPKWPLDICCRSTEQFTILTKESNWGTTTYTIVYNTEPSSAMEYRGQSIISVSKRTAAATADGTGFIIVKMTGLFCSIRKHVLTGSKFLVPTFKFFPPMFHSARSNDSHSLLKISISQRPHLQREMKQVPQ